MQTLAEAPGPPVALLSDHAAGCYEHAAATALLGPERPKRKGLRAAAAGIVDFLRDGQAAALRVIDSAA